ncbi:3D-(3,5/4)-trihydroxycyclohexane-1,2-dione hydrolase [Jatrophihabitans sp. GAS493]|uniref:3D-(3,5/4)-trihydroxycyclohexane-1,2-dione acylhydrolase (decyclizing) n=1 Tax=Jatrophihabitans sp. GAS493 TaxID=1907575 RepID=UPI000BB71645|nr:3D-(3,5/4)-trihydroxycyclohexane-1,2-dione acylhydrolase (decyclizing) [Jatrophihabitans sp. GAS493]SOD73719.1 3D-(3,5/4)-trihydroxycyclohexane-1,2-dione hydrolase [Jatrophihabitans sp. GAS493]
MTQTVRLTTAQALVRWMIAQRAERLDGTEIPMFAGVFAIFGHGNVLGLGTALSEVRDELPTFRGQSEEGMALAAAAYGKASDRRQVMAATSSVGPGALNMVTAAGLAHANRLPLLLLPGDTFVSRAPDPVLQQVEHYGDLSLSVNDAFRPVARFFDRITRPEQLLASLPQVARVLTDPADCGPVVLALPQDVQAEEFDFPVALFAHRLNRVPRARPDSTELAQAAQLLRAARRPLVVSGGGVRYSGAGTALLEFAQRHGIPIAETSAGRTLIPDPHPLNAGPLGTIGSSSANALAGEADLVLAVGTRLQDFTTSSWSVFQPSARLVSINAARFDAVKHGGQAVTGDARETVEELDEALAGWSVDAAWTARAAVEKAVWNSHIDGLRAGASADGSLTYAQVVGAVNDASGPDDYVLGSSGGIPGELNGGWRTGAASAGPTMDLEYGFSCMGYEIAGPWGASMARGVTHPDGLVTALLGDGSYLMLNSELFGAAFSGHPFVAVVCDNGGYAVIHRLQTNQGAQGFNNMFVDSTGPGAKPGGVRVDFAAHATALGCAVVDVAAGAGIEEFRQAYDRARTLARSESRPAVVVCRTDPGAWTESGAWWEVGVPSTLTGRAGYDEGKTAQLRYTV